MRRTVAISVLATIMASASSPALAVDGKRVNGRAVSVQWKWGLKDWVPMICSCWDMPLIGSVNLFTITNGRVSRTDTIYNRMSGYAGYPAFNISGTRIAFYRAGYGPVAAAVSDQCAIVNGGQNSICVMDFEGNNLTKLCDIGTGVLGIVNDLSMGIDWPAGDWIYYVRPNEGKTSYVEAASWRLWKVNVRTKENIAVYDPTDQCGFARRFQLDLSGTRMGAQGLPAHGCDGVSINGVCSFPPNPDGTLNNVIGYCGCNAAISPSANYGANFCGSHADLYIEHNNWTNHSASSIKMTTMQLTDWSGDNFGLDVDGVRWACNSDKWVLQQCSPNHGQMATSDMVAGNWVDKAAIKMSNNPQVETVNTVNGTFYFGNEPGDMWIDGEATNKGKYEDETGAWRTVPGYDPSLAEYVGTGATMSSGSLKVPAMAVSQLTPSMDAAGTIRIGLGSHASAEIRIMDMQGKCRYAATATTALTLPVGTLKPGLYHITKRSGSTSVGVQLLVSR